MLRQTLPAKLARLKLGRSRTLGRNLTGYRSELGVAVSYHATTVAMRYDDGGLELRHGGWSRSMTTHRLIMELVQLLGYPHEIRRMAGEWWVVRGTQLWRWREGITLYPDGRVIGADSVDGTYRLAVRGTKRDVRAALKRLNCVEAVITDTPIGLLVTTADLGCATALRLALDCTLL